MAVSGEKAQALLRTMVDAVSNLVPDDVSVTVRGRGRRCTVSAAWLADPAQVSREKPQGGSLSGITSPFGVGPGIPFLPRRTAAKLTIEDALQQIQQVVSHANRSPWPGPGYQVRVAVTDEGIHAWFADESGAVMEIGTFDDALASNRRRTR